jgi:hypothetical protein
MTKNPSTEAGGILHEAKRLRLLAAALELQHFTSTESNVVPIPGGDRVIAIGTPAQVRALLAADVDAAAPVDAAAICDGVAAKSKNSLFRSGAKICAGEIRAAQVVAGGDQADSEGGHHD